MKAWEYLDQFSVQPTLFVNSRHRFTSKVGLIMSMATILAIVILSVFFLSSFFQKRDVSVLSFTEFKQDIIHFDLNLKPFMFRLYHINDEGEEFDVDPSIAQIHPNYMIQTPDNFNVITMEYEPCKFEEHLPDPFYQKELFPDGISKLKCIKPGKYNLNLTHTPFRDERTYINVYIADCVNSTENNNFCKPEEEIASTLRNYNMYFKWVMPSASVDHSDVKNPIKRYYQSNGDLSIYYDFLYTYENIFKKVIYSSDDGLEFENFIDQYGYQ
jgi:hypothetical protein